MIRTPLAGVVAAGLLLAGCVRPPAVPPAEQAIATPALGLSQMPAPRPNTRWWSALGDPQFDRLVDQALAHGPAFAEALARLRAARAQSAAAEAGRWPQASLSGDDFRQRFSKNDIYPPPYGGGVFWEGNITANLSWDIDFWGRQAALISQSRSRADAAALDAVVARSALVGALAQAYVDLDRGYALLDVAERTLAQRQNILAITKKRVASGLDTNVELREADGAVAQARVDRTAAANAIDRARHQIAALIGAGAGAYAKITRPTLDAEAVLPLPAALPADLLAHRPDVTAAKLRIAAATAGSKAAKAQFYPDVNLMAFAGIASFGIAQLVQASSAAYGVGPAIHLPLFDAGLLESQYRGSVAEIDLAVATYNDTVIKAIQQVADGISDIGALDRELRDQRQTLDDAEDAYKLASERYNAGLTNYLTELNAETQLLAARRQRVDLAHAQVMNRIRLVIEIGGSYDPTHPLTRAQDPVAPAVSDNQP